MEERELAAAILGELIPELEYAAPRLLDRLESGAPLVDRKSPSDLGFEIGTIDVQLLDLFRVLAPYVSAALGYGILGMVQSWLLHDREKKSQDELLAELRSLRIEKAELRQTLDSIAAVLSHADKVPVSQFEIDEAIAAAVARLAQEKR